MSSTNFDAVQNEADLAEARRLRKVRLEAARRERFTSLINNMRTLLMEARPQGYNAKMEQLDILQLFRSQCEQKVRELEVLRERNVMLKAEIKVRRITENAASRKRKLSEEDSGRFSTESIYTKQESKNGRAKEVDKFLN
uniref:BHLH domain-containing protein n=1 Tax=Bursaphelenchus xylophilus TaxID=6326 RepID=A0A1I7RP05_BURXY